MHYDGHPVDRPWVTPPLLQALRQAGTPMSVSDVDSSHPPGHDHTGFLTALCDQLVTIGGLARLPDGRYQLTPLGRHGCHVVLDPGPCESTRG